MTEWKKRSPGVFQKLKCLLEETRDILEMEAKVIEKKVQGIKALRDGNLAKSRFK